MKAKSRQETYLDLCEELRIAERKALLHPHPGNIKRVIELQKQTSTYYSKLPSHHQNDPATKPGQGIGNGPRILSSKELPYKPPTKVPRELRRDLHHWAMSWRGQDN